MTTTGILDSAAARGTPLAARLAATWRADTASILAIGLGVFIVLLAAPMLVSGLVGLAESGGSVDIGLSSPAETFAAMCVVLSIVSSGSAALGRRESAVGGWTRRERLVVVTLHTAAFAVLATVGWFVLRGLTPWFNDLAASLLSGSDRSIVIFDVAGQPAALVIIVALVVLGAAVPQVLVAAHRIGVLALAVAIVATLIVSSQCVSAFVAIAIAAVAAPVAGDVVAWSVTLAIVGVVVFVALAAWAMLRGPIARFR